MISFYSQNTSDNKCVCVCGFPTPTSSPALWPSASFLEFSSFLMPTTQSLCSAPHPRLRAHPQDCPPLLMPIAVVCHQHYPQFCLTWLQTGGSMTHPWVWLICKNGSQNSGKHLLMFTNLLKDMMKDTDEQQDEEIHKQCLGGSQVQKLLFLLNWDPLPSRNVDVLTNPEAF